MPYTTQWKQKKVSEIKSVTLKSRWRTLEKYAFPYLGDNPIAEITPQQLHDTAIPLFERGVSHTGKLVIALVNEIMNFAVNKGIIEFNKCINVSKAFNVNRTTHHPTIRPEKLPEFIVCVTSFTY